MTPLPTPARVSQRLLSKIEVSDHGCWLSLYSTGSHGYSQIGWQADGKVHMRLGHRVSWEAHNGPIPAGMTVDHLCRVRRCVNPRHLRLLDNLANATDNGKDRHRTPEPMGKMCGRGTHELMRYASGAVACRECSNERNRRKKRKRRTA